VLKNDVRLAVDILGDILQHSTFLEEELAREKDVIIQEIAMHRDTPDDLLVDYFDETMFPQQPLGRSILSTEAKIAATTRDDVIRYMQTHYTPPRMVLSAAGAIDHEQFVSLAEEYFDLPKRDAGPDHVTANYIGGDRRVTSDLEQLHLALGLPAVSMHSPDFYVMQLYASILGGGMSSRLFQEVRERRGLAYSVYAMGSAYVDVGVMSIYAATSPDKGGELSLVLCDELKRMADTISDAELERAKNQMKAELIMSRENPQNIASWIGRHLLNYGEYRQMATLRERIDAVTTRDIVRFARQLLNGAPTIAALGDVSHVAAYDTLKQKLT
jgi:predicted Zn-dependent peptidase